MLETYSRIVTSCITSMKHSYTTHVMLKIDIIPQDTARSFEEKNLVTFTNVLRASLSKAAKECDAGYGNKFRTKMPETRLYEIVRERITQPAKSFLRNTALFQNGQHFDQNFKSIPQPRGGSVPERRLRAEGANVRREARLRGRLRRERMRRCGTARHGTTTGHLGITSLLHRF